MPLFDLNYEGQLHPDTMTFVGEFPGTAERVEINPHMCQVHEDNPEADHRGLIDMTFYNEAMLGDLPIAAWMMKPEMAAAIIEGLQDVIPLAILNKGPGE